MKRTPILFLCAVALLAGFALFSGVACADVTSVTSVTIQDRVGTLAEGDSGTRRMLLFNIVCDAPTTVSQIHLFLEGANLAAQGPSIPDGYERGVRSISIYSSDVDGTTLGLAFVGAQTYNEYYTSQEDNPIKRFSGVSWGATTAVYLNLLPGNNYFLIVYDFSVPNGQPAGVVRNYAGERYWCRLESVKDSAGSTTVANIMGPQVYVTGTVVGTTFDVITDIYDDRVQVGLTVDASPIMALRITTTNTTATWNDFLLRSGGTGDDTRVGQLQVWEDTTGEGVFSPPSLGPPEDTLVTTVDIPFIVNNGQVYHIFPSSILVQPYSSRLFFFCYVFDPSAPHATNNGFNLTVVNLGGGFKILEPYDPTTLNSATLTLLPLPNGLDIAVGPADPPLSSYDITPTLADRYPIMQLRLTAHGQDCLVNRLKFAYTVTSTGQPQTIYALELWLDANNFGSGSVDSSDILLATITQSEILANPAFFTFNLAQALRVNDRSFANVLLVGIFTDKATAAYGFTLYGDGISGSNFNYVRFYPSIAPLYSNWLIFNTVPVVDPPPPTSAPPTVTTALPPVGDGGVSNAQPWYNDTGVGVPGSIYQGGGGGCFVATAAFGSSVSTVVEGLCDLRDSSLAAGSVRALVSLYYQVGPGVAGAVRCSPSARALVRDQLIPLVLLAR